MQYINSSSIIIIIIIIIIIVGVIGLGIYIYVYIGQRPSPRTLNSPRTVNIVIRICVGG